MVVHSCWSRVFLVLVFCFYFIYFAQKFKWEKALEKKREKKRKLLPVS